MKKILLSSLQLLLCASIAFGQIPNQGFEDWTNTGSYLAPDGWWTTNDSSSGTFYPVTRSTDHYPVSIGSYSIRLENNISVLPDWGGLGIAWTGDWNGNNYPVFPVTGHPASLHGYYKFLPQNNDTMSVHIRLYKNGIDISGGQFKSAATVNSWTTFSMVFSSYTDADSARIMIASCFDNDAPNPHGNSVLYIDNLNFDSPIPDDVSELTDVQKISIYPNPSGDLIFISIAGNIWEGGNFDLYNTVGQKIATFQNSRNNNTTTMDLLKFPEGIYYLKITLAGMEYFVRKIIIAR